MSVKKKQEWIADADASTNFEHIKIDAHMDARERAMIGRSGSEGMTFGNL